MNVINRRSSSRFAVSVPIEVILTDGNGRQICERTKIEDVSDFGCRFSIKSPIEQGAKVTMKILGLNLVPLPNDPPRVFEIMWVARKENRSIVGARLLEGEKFDTAGMDSQSAESQVVDTKGGS